MTIPYKIPDKVPSRTLPITSLLSRSKHKIKKCVKVNHSKVNLKAGAWKTPWKTLPKA
jgi:hypothetical protein